MTTETYDSPVEVLSGLWEPFGRNVSRFLARMGDQALPVVGRITEEDAERLYADMFQTVGDDATTVLGGPGAPSLVDGLGLFVVWKDDAAIQKAAELAPQYGISFDPEYSGLIEPLGLRGSPTPYEVPGVDTSKYAGTRGARTDTPVGAVGDSFDEIYGGMFYDRNWLPENVKHPSEEYMGVLNSAVDATDPNFLSWHEAAINYWMGAPSDLRQQFLYDLMRNNEQAWADFIHECIFPPGDRPSDTVTPVLPDSEGSDSEGSEEDDGRGGKETVRDLPVPDPILPQPSEPPVPDPILPQPSEPPVPDPILPTPDGPTPPKDRNPDRNDWHMHMDSPSREHPLDPEAWDRHGLGFLRWLTPGGVEEWLMNNYNHRRQQERLERGDINWNPSMGWDNYWKQQERNHQIRYHGLDAGRAH